MLAPNFNKYSLALIKEDKILHSSNKSGLRPLIECVDSYKDKVSGCVLHDKVIGLAAARIIVYSGIISSVISRICSKSAQELLKNNIKTKTEKIVNNILNKERTSACPMETKAKEIVDNESFHKEVKRLFRL